MHHDLPELKLLLQPLNALELHWDHLGIVAGDEYERDIAVFKRLGQLERRTYPEIDVDPMEVSDSPNQPGRWTAVPAQSLRRFGEFVTLTDPEMAEVRGLADKPVALARGAVIRAQGVEPTCVYLLIEGWASAAVDLDNGSRQITKVHLPGDLMGTPSMCLTETADALTALTPVVVTRLPLDRFARLFNSSPRFAMAMFLSAQRERIALIDTLTRLGQRSALERLAGLLLDLYERLSAAGLAQANQFDLQLRQHEIADVLGISFVHVNRVFKTLVKDGLIRQCKRHIEIVDEEALIRLAHWTRRPIAPALTWMA